MSLLNDWNEDSLEVVTDRYYYFLYMGSLCSKSAVHSGGHTVLGPVSDYPASSAPPNPRVAAAEAAERRLKAVSCSSGLPHH